MKTYRCHCDQEIELDVEDQVDLDASPAAVDAISDGSFLATKCPHCGTIVKPEFPLRFTSRQLKLDVYMVTEQERLAAYQDKCNGPRGVEIVVSFSELSERVRMLRSGFDPRAVEVLKYFIQEKAEEAEPGSALSVFFHHGDPSALTFRIKGFASGQSGELKIPYATYEATKAELPSYAKKEPFAEVFSGSYRSIRKLVLSGDEED